MSDKYRVVEHHEAEITDLSTKRDKQSPPPVVVRGPPDPFTVADPGGGEVIFFDCALAYAYGNGTGSVTLTTQQQLIAPDGTPFDQRRITAVLKGSLAAFRHLKNVIVEIERRADDEVAAAVAALEKPAGMAH